MKWFDYARLDRMLEMFYERKYIPNTELFEENRPDEWDSVLEFLLDEGYLKEYPDGIEITYRGKAKYRAGGFTRENLKERILFYSAICSTACGIGALAVSILALCN